MATTAERLRIEVEADTDAATKGLQGLEDKGSKVPGWVGVATKAIVGFGAAAATYFGAKAVLQGGLSRLMNIEDAQAALKGIGHTQESISTIMDSALSSVRGTAFGLGDAAKIAATAVAAGIQPGQALTDTLRLTANTAALAQTSLGEMGSILNKVWTSGRVGTEELNQLADRGIPIWTKLAESYGVSADELRKMVSEGKVDAASFAQVLTGTVGEAAIAMGDTTRGAFANMNASVARVGANLLQGVFPMFKEALQGITAALGPVEAAAKAWGESLGSATTTAVDAFKAWSAETGAAFSATVALLRSGDFTSAFREATGVEEDSPLVSVLLNIRSAVVDTVAEVRGGLTAMRAAFSEGGTDVTSSGIAGVLEAIGLAARNFLDPVREALGALGPAFGQIVGQVASVASAFSPLHMVITALTPVLPVLGQVVGQVAATLAGTLMGALQSLLPALAQVATMLTGALAQAFAALMPAIQTLLPQIATLVSTLVGALLPVLAAIMPVLVQVASTILGAVVQAFTALLPVITSLLPVITTVADVVGQVLLVAVQALSPLITMLADVFAALVPALTPVISAVVSVVSALAPVVGIVGDLIGALLPPLVDLFMALLQPILDLIAPLVGALAPILTTVATIISSLLVPIIGTLADWLGRLVGFVTPVTTVISGGLVSAISTLIGWVVQAVSAIVSFAGDAIGAFGRFATGAGEKVGEAIAFVTGIPGQVLGVFADAGSWLVDSGKKIIQGLIDGVKNMAGKVVDAVSGVLSSARDLLPFSPAKKGPFSGKGWTLYSGRSISSALAEGIQDNAGDVVSATRALASAAAMNLPGPSIGTPSVYGAGSGAASGASGPSPADALGVGSASGYGGPSTIVVVDADGNLIGRMRVEAGKVATGAVTPLDEGRSGW